MATNINHNKKRNTGLVVEFVTRYISRMLIDGNAEQAATAVSILRHHVKPGSELHKEYRLFNALANSSVSSDAIAAVVIREARDAAKKHDLVKLDNEKSNLIKELNKKLNCNTLFNEEIADYRTYATIQTLLNDWRSDIVDPLRMAKFEETVIKRLTEKKDGVNLVEHVNTDVDGLVIKLMTEKFNGRYGDLSTVQKQVIREYVSPADGDTLRLMGMLEGIRTETLDVIQAKLKDPDMSEYIKNKMRTLSEIVLKDDISNPRDGTIVRFLGMAQLVDEFKNEEAH